MSTDGPETERVSVSTYVPAYQRETWAAEAESMDVSRSEYVRLMVQAGRRSFELDNPGGRELNTSTNGALEAGEDADGTTVTEDNPDNSHHPGANHGGSALRDRVLDLLDSDGYLDWDELVAGLTEDIEDRLDETLDELQSEGRVRHSGRHGGYTVVDDE